MNSWLILSLLVASAFASEPAAPVDDAVASTGCETLKFVHSGGEVVDPPKIRSYAEITGFEVLREFVEVPAAATGPNGELVDLDASEVTDSEYIPEIPIEDIATFDSSVSLADIQVPAIKVTDTDELPKIAVAEQPEVIPDFKEQAEQEVFGNVEEIKVQEPEIVTEFPEEVKEHIHLHPEATTAEATPELTNSALDSSVDSAKPADSSSSTSSSSSESYDEEVPSQNQSQVTTTTPPLSLRSILPMGANTTSSLNACARHTQAQPASRDIGNIIIDHFTKEMERPMSGPILVVFLALFFVFIMSVFQSFAAFLAPEAVTHINETL